MTGYPSLPQHPERAGLQAEAHARPPMPIDPEDREIWHWVIFESGDAAWPSPIKPGERHQRLRLDDGYLRVERHTEFTSLTYRGARAPGPETTALIEACPGRQLAGLRVGFRDTLDATTLTEHFGAIRLFGGRVNDGKVEVATDFQVGEDRMVTVLVAGPFEDPYSRGRVAKRLMELETYRMGALLGLAEVRRAEPDLARLEQTASQIIVEMSRSREEAGLSSVIQDLAGLLTDVHCLRDRTRFRIGASLAYHDIVRRRLGVIQEQPVGERQTLTGFIEHRLSPAINTVEAFDRRLDDLDDAVSKALELARTCVERQVADQNHDLLISMEGRARQQVHLGQAVEGMSVAAITYYGSGLVSTALKGLPDWYLSDSVLTAISVPFIALGVWVMANRARREVERMIGSDPHAGPRR